MIRLCFLVTMTQTNNFSSNFRFLTIELNATAIENGRYFHQHQS